MGLETISSNSTPEVLREDWPVGTTDGSVFGAIHLRNIKTVLKNFFAGWKSFNSWFDNLKGLDVDGDPSLTDFKVAADCDYVDNKQVAYFRNAANLLDPIPPTKCDRATLDRKGLTYISHLTDSAAVDRVVTVKALRTVVEGFEKAYENSENIKWAEMPLGASDTALGIPARAAALLDEGHDIDLMWTLEIRHYVTKQVMGYSTFYKPIMAETWDDPRSGGSGNPSFISDHYTIPIPGSPDTGFVPWIIHQKEFPNSIAGEYISSTYMGKIINGFYRRADKRVI